MIQKKRTTNVRIVMRIQKTGRRCGVLDCQLPSWRPETQGDGAIIYDAFRFPTWFNGEHKSKNSFQVRCQPEGGSWSSSSKPRTKKARCTRTTTKKVCLYRVIDHVRMLSFDLPYFPSSQLAYPFHLPPHTFNCWSIPGQWFSAIGVTLVFLSSCSGSLASLIVPSSKFQVMVTRESRIQTVSSAGSAKLMTEEWHHLEKVDVQSMINRRIVIMSSLHQFPNLICSTYLSLRNHKNVLETRDSRLESRDVEKKTRIRCAFIRSRWR